MKGAIAKLALKVADEVWLAVAMLHQKHPERQDFSIEEIMEFARTAKELRSLGPLRPGFYVHVVQHCVANRVPNPARYKMLLETSPGRRRLYRASDPCHPLRDKGRNVPRAEDLPENWFRGLLQWYQQQYTQMRNAKANDPLLALVGSGRDLWGDENPDEYVRRLREGWE